MEAALSGLNAFRSSYVNLFSNMKHLHNLLLLLLFAGCSNPSSHDQAVTDSVSVEVTTEQPAAPPAASVIETADSLSYIGFINKFYNSSDFYVDLFFKEGKGYDIEKIRKMANQVIASTDEMKRSQLPIEKAMQYLELDGLREIKVYSKDNQLVATGTLTSVEYYEDMIEGSLVAVFTLDHPDISDFSYCIGNLQGELTSVKVVPYKGDEVRFKIAEHLGLDPEKMMDEKHYKEIESGEVYSVFRVHENYYIVGTTDEKISLLYKGEPNEVIFDLVIVPKLFNGRPLLLTSCGMDETDMTWNSLLKFNGTEYEVSRNNLKIE